MPRPILYALNAACYAALLAVLFSAVNIQASLIGVDWLSPGDGLLTRDSGTGLEWLDLTETTNWATLDLLDELAPGGAFEGFHLASVAEIDGLYSSAGLSVFLSTAPRPHFSTEPAVVAAAGQLFSLMNITQSYGGGVETGFLARHSPVTQTSSHASNLFVDQDGRTFLIDEPPYSVQTTVPTAFGLVDCCASIGVPGEARPDTGHFLVRPVPEPTTALLVACGLVGLAVRGRRAR